MRRQKDQTEFQVRHKLFYERQVRAELANPASCRTHKASSQLYSTRRASGESKRS